MKKTIISTLVTATVLSQLMLSGQASQNTISKDKSASAKMLNQPVVGVIKGDVESGCGCSLQSPADHRKRSSRQVFVSGTLYEGGLMNIDGRDTKLKFVSEKRNKKGDTVSTTYSANGIRVRVDYVLAETGYEYALYNATITVSRGGRNKIVRVKGYCGC